MRSQSAMEYLMTYGWAIIIIAIILAALYQLGVFNPYSFSPKVASGACKIARGIVDGQVTSSRVGTCNNALPQYVAQFDGASSHITTPYMTTNMVAVSVSAWINLPNINYGANPRIVSNGHTDEDFNGIQMMITSGGTQEMFWVGNTVSSWRAQGLSQMASGVWYNYVGTYDQAGGLVAVYLDGQQLNTAGFMGVVSGPLPMAIGYDPAYSGDFFKGYMSNVQIYNASLTANEVLALYNEGIGGAPIDTRKIVDWWPLNGDVKDYSGNGNDGTATAVTFTGSWMNGYTAP